MENFNSYPSKKLNIITVGTGQNGQDVAHAINYSIDKQNPDYICFLLSPKSKDTTFPFIDTKKKKYDVFSFDEIDDVETLIKEYSNVFSNYLNKGFKKENINADFTSGTKAMSSALLDVALNFDIRSVSYVYGQRGEGGRVITGTERIHIIEPSFIFLQKKIYLFKVLFNKYQFDAALKILQSNVSIHPDYQNTISTFSLLAKTYSAWDKFNFNDAFDYINQINCQDLLSKYEIKSIIEKHKQILHKLKDKKIDNHKIIDLISNALRRSEEGKYDDAVARLYRSLEMIAQMEFENVCKCKTDDVNPEAIPENIKEEFVNKYKDKKDNKIKLPLWATFEVLKYKNNEKANIFFQNNEDIKKHLFSRNNSILAHGFAPVSKQSFDKFFALLSDKFAFKNIHKFINLNLDIL